MSYLVFARRYRPQSFDDVAGQSAVITTLSNALSSGRIAHAFLFAGPRGVGKTTTARLLAKALNCAKGPGPDPCGTCPSCIEITEGKALDVLEIDGASNRGIDDVKALRESVQYSPARDPFKVVIIDEIHMLSTPAFNALLKTLEEPPPHVKFVFATTELHKVPATILSRCQVYEFRRIGFAETIERLRLILEREKVTADDAALALVARHADGCLRDAQSALDQVVSFGGTTITEEVVRSVLGLVGQEILFETMDAVLEENAGRVLEVTDRLVDGGLDLRQFLASFAEHVRNILVVQVARDPGPLVAVAPSDLDRLREQASRLSEEEALRLLNLLALAEEEMRRCQQPRFALERTLLKLVHARRLTPIGDLLAGLDSRAVEPEAPGRPAAAPAAPASAGRPQPSAPPSRPGGPRRPATSEPSRPRGSTPIARKTNESSTLAGGTASSLPIRPAARETALEPESPPADEEAPPAVDNAAARARAEQDPALGRIKDLFRAELLKVEEPS